MKRIAVFIFLLFLCYSFSYAQSAPEDVFKAYVTSLQKGDTATYLGVLTVESRQIVNAAPALMKNEYNVLRDLTIRVQPEGNDKVSIVFVPSSSKVPPYIMIKEGGEWKVDLKSMSREYGFDNEDHWHRRDRNK